MFNPSKVSFAEGTLAESVIDFSNVEKGRLLIWEWPLLEIRSWNPWI